MKINSVLSLTTIGSVLAFSARADLYDNFDSYADQAAFDAVWTTQVGGGVDLYTGQSVSAPNSVMNPSTAAGQSWQLMAPINATLLDFSYDFYDFDASNSARDSAMAYSRAGNAWSDGLNQILVIGKYNNIAGTKYFGRVAFASGATYGDGIGTVASTWFQLNAASPDKSVGWHTARILGMADPVNVGMVRYEFYLDGILGGSVNNVNNSLVGFNFAVLGSGLSTAPSPIAIDNVSFVTVPEPSSITLCLLGGFGLAAGVISRRRKV